MAIRRQAGYGVLEWVRTMPAKCHKAYLKPRARDGAMRYGDTIDESLLASSRMAPYGPSSLLVVPASRG